MNEYARGWDDCLDIVRSILQESEDLKKALEKIEGVHVLVKEKKFEQIKRELGVLENAF